MHPQVRATCKHLLVVLAQQTSPCLSSRVALGIYAAHCSHNMVTRWQRKKQLADWWCCRNRPCCTAWACNAVCGRLQEAARSSSRRESNSKGRLQVNPMSWECCLPSP